MITHQLSEYLAWFYSANGFVPHRIRLHRSQLMRLCWEQDVPLEKPEGFSHTFMGIVVDQRADA